MTHGRLTINEHKDYFPTSSLSDQYAPKYQHLATYDQRSNDALAWQSINVCKLNHLRGDVTDPIVFRDMKRWIACTDGS